VYKDLVGKPEEKRQLGRQRRLWEDGIRIGLTEISLGRSHGGGTVGPLGWGGGRVFCMRDICIVTCVRFPWFSNVSTAVTME
jgi:hypothetical protein